MAEKLGTIDLKAQASDLEKRIEREIKSAWLDGGTAFGFKKELEAKVATGNVRDLEYLLRKVTREVQDRKTKYGNGSQRTASL